MWAQIRPYLLSPAWTTVLTAASHSSCTPACPWPEPITDLFCHVPEVKPSSCDSTDSQGSCHYLWAFSCPWHLPLALAPTTICVFASGPCHYKTPAAGLPRQERAFTGSSHYCCLLWSLVAGHRCAAENPSRPCSLCTPLACSPRTTQMSIENSQICGN